MLAWRKIISPKQAEAWTERLAGMGAERLVVTETGGRARLEIFEMSEAEAHQLCQRFGGQIRNLAKSNADWVRSVVQRRPISIRGRLLVHNGEPPPSLPEDRRALYIPAEMAFGTGDHATTATCLRCLCDHARSLLTTRWSFLDVGCGT
ncbi:MAG: 50S ribosomal protein L11 methyltransferase, partial [Verrucomicrobia bacterium]|nr:50S ribosomal protein L11 methyltransferase [Verrucomicrobiota bacterium]